MGTSQGKHEELESRLRLHLKLEAEKGDLSAERWQAMLANATASKQERHSHWLRASLNLPVLRRVPAVVLTLMLLVMVGGASLWVASPWDRTLPGGPVPVPGRPVPVPGRPGRPAPTYLQPTWMTSKELVTPGEPFTISLTVKNHWDKPIETRGFPRTATLDQVDVPGNVSVSVPAAFEGSAPDSMQPGDEVTLVVGVNTDVSAGLETGRYSVHMDFQFGYTPQQPDAGTTRLGLNSGILFVVVPPEGVLNQTVQVGQTRVVEGVSITLEYMRFAPDQTTIAAEAVLSAWTPNPPPAQETSVPRPPGAPTPTPTPVPPATPPAASPPASVYVPATELLPTPAIDALAGQRYAGSGPAVAPPATPTPTAQTTPVGGLAQGAPTPTPTRMPLPPGFDTSFYGASAWYRVDGGRWRELRSLGYRGTPEGVHLEWTFGPVSRNAKTFDFALTRLLTNGQTIDGVWSWSVPL